MMSFGTFGLYFSVHVEPECRVFRIFLPGVAIGVKPLLATFFDVVLLGPASARINVPKLKVGLYYRFRPRTTSNKQTTNGIIS